jgi:hypothetical protein
MAAVKDGVKLEARAWGAWGWRAVVWLGEQAPGWARQWQFWLTLAVGAFLRLSWLGRSPFYSDSALLYLEAARAAHDHLLPGTGIYSSLLALNMPLYTLLLYPFANDPQRWTLVQAAANVAAVGLLYIWAERAFGRWAALAGGLLFATALYDTYMGGFVWQQCLLPPLVIGALYTLHLGMVERRRHWFIPHALLLAAAIQVHPITAALLPLSVVGLAMGWEAVTWYDFYLGVAGAVALYIPTTLFEVASHGYDLPIYVAYLAAPRVLDGQTVQQISAALGPRPWDWLGADTRYAAAARALPWLEPVMDGLVALSLGWLAVMGVWRPLRDLTPRPPLLRGEGEARRRWWASRPDALSLAERQERWRVWRARLLVVGAPAVFLALTLRHASPIYIHYAFVVTPPLYVAVGAFVAGLPGQARRLAKWVANLTPWPPLPWGEGEWSERLRRLGWAAPSGARAAVAAVMIVAQMALTGAFALTLASGESPASTWGAVPTTSYMAAMTATGRAAAALHARNVFLAGDPGDPFMGLYWAQRGNNLAGSGGPLWTAYTADACALTPPAGAGAAPTLVMDRAGLAIRALLGAPGTREIGKLALAREATYPLVAVAPNAAGLPAPGLAVVNGELRLDRAFTLPAGGGLPARLVTLWTALRSTPPGPAAAIYHFHFLFHGTGGEELSARVTCAPGSWVAGEGVVVVAPLPAGAQADAAPGVIVSRETHSWWRPQIGGLTLETAKELFLDPVVLPLSRTYGPGLARPSQAQLDAATIRLPLSAGW